MFDEQEITETIDADSFDEPAVPGAPESQPHAAEKEWESLLDGHAAAKSSGDYDLNLPEDIRWGVDEIAAFKGHAHDLGLTQDQAQKLLHVAHTNQQAHLEAHAAQVKRWADEVAMDKVMGGPHLEATVMQAKAGLTAFDAEGQVFAMLQQTGYANHPAVIGFLARIGRAHGEDKVIMGKSTGEELPLWERLYGKKS